MRVAIVEDEKVIAERLERMTRELLEGHIEMLSCFDTFDAARTYLQRTAIDLLLLDLNLHGRDGLDLLKETGKGYDVKAEEWRTKLPEESETEKP